MTNMTIRLLKFQKAAIEKLMDAMEDICKEIIEGKCLKYYYTPVIDLKNKT